MPLYIALLRGINVGGRKLVAMSDLRDMLADLGLADGRSLLQSGNLVFDGGKRTGPALERLLEGATEKRLGARVEYFVRSAPQWRAIVAANPFTGEARSDPGHLVVMCFKKPPPAAGVAALRAAVHGPEVIQPVRAQLYITYPNGIGRSKLTNAVIEKQLGLSGTARNWNTILKIAAALPH